MDAKRVLSAIKRWLGLAPTSATHSGAVIHGELLTPSTSPERPESPPSSTATQREADTIGDHTPRTDWLGAKLHVGDWIDYISESKGSGLTRTTSQKVLGEILTLTDDGGAVVHVLKRSRSAPSRLVVKLSAVGLASATKIAGRDWLLSRPETALSGPVSAA